MLIGSVGMIVFLALAAYYIENTASGGSALMICLIGFFGFSQGLLFGVLFLKFSKQCKIERAIIGKLTHWVMAAVISWSFPVVAEKVPHGGSYAFMFFSAMMLLHLIFVWKVLPETKGRSLENIQEELGIV